MGDFIFNEIVTFELTKNEIESLYKPARKRVNTTYALLAILFTVVAVVTFFLELPIVAAILVGALLVATIIYLVNVRKLNKELAKQLKLIEIKRYNYALYENELIVTVKDDVSPFNEYIVDLEDVDARILNDIWTFNHKGVTYAVPKRVLRESSRFYKYAR